MSGRGGFPAERRLQRDVGRLKDRLREAVEIIVWQASLIDEAGLDVASLIERRERIIGESSEDGDDSG